MLLFILVPRWSFYPSFFSCLDFQNGIFSLTENCWDCMHFWTSVISLLGPYLCINVFFVITVILWWKYKIVLKFFTLQIMNTKLREALCCLEFHGIVMAMHIWIIEWPPTRHTQAYIFNSDIMEGNDYSLRYWEFLSCKLNLPILEWGGGGIVLVVYLIYISHSRPKRKSTMYLRKMNWWKSVLFLQTIFV